jgi:hypothetical protein
MKGLASSWLIPVKDAGKRHYKGENMKKQVFPRLVALTVLYITVLVVLVVIQFPQDASVVDRARVRRALSENRYFNPAAFVIPDAQTSTTYNTLLAQWRDTNFALWAKRVTEGTAVAEDTILAYLAESLMRGEYEAAQSAVPGGYERNSASVVFLGRLDQGLRSFTEQDRIVEARFLRLSSLNGSALLSGLQPSDAAEARQATLPEYFATRGNLDQLNSIARSIRAIAPASVSLEHVPEIFAGYTVWARYAPIPFSLSSSSPSTENPFTHLLDPAYRLLGESLTLHPDGKRVFVCSDATADIAFNLRLAQTLIRYSGEEDSDLTALGRSLILSALSLNDENGMLPARLFFDFSATGNVREDIDRLDSAWIYHLLDMGEYAPHAVHLGGSAWLWTAAPVLSLNNEGATKLPQSPLDIAVSFQPGQTHYLFLRGVPRPTSLQLHGEDSPSNSNFEQESSGWSYSPSAQSVLLKLTHREAVEHIVVSY